LKRVDKVNYGSNKYRRGSTKYYKNNFNQSPKNDSRGRFKELITSKFLDQNYYILTSYGKDDNITPSQYGTLAVILALSKEVDENIKLNDLKEIFGNVWSSDIKFLIDNDYIREFENLGIIKVTPLGKALLKNIVQDLKLKNLLRIFE